MYIDTHCHLNFSQYDADRAMVMGNAKKAGVKQFICPSVDMPSSKNSIDLAMGNPGIVYAAIGYHPYEAQNDPSIEALSILFHDEKRQDNRQIKTIIALGECGLDYHIYKGEAAAGKKDKQKRLFHDQLNIALRLNIPVIIHCREAFEDLFTILDSMPKMPKGVIHCFSGGLQELRMATDRNLYVGLDGNITYSKYLTSILPFISLSQLLLETDSPYLTPIPHRGTRNEPKYIPIIAKHVATTKHIAVEDVKHHTTRNTQELFNLIS